MKNNIYLVHLFDWTKFICKFTKFLQKCLVDNFLTQSGQSILLKITSKTFTCRTRLFMALEVIFYIEKNTNCFVKWTMFKMFRIKLHCLFKSFCQIFQQSFFCLEFAFWKHLHFDDVPKKAKKSEEKPSPKLSRD